MEKFKCPLLQVAYDKATANAFEDIVYPDADVLVPPSLGNHASLKGTLTGNASCECGKKIKVTLQLKGQPARRLEHEGTITVYDIFSYNENVKTSGGNCIQ